LTGHLVLSTLHTNDSPAAVTRLLELGVPPYLIKSTLIGVLAQRLVRTLCPHCRKPADLAPEHWQELNLGDAVPRPQAIRAATGCLECRQTGYLGRTGVYELMPVTSAVRSAIGPSTDLAELRQLAMRDGMRPLRHAGAAKVAAGLTSIGEVLALTPDPQRGD
jgi:general secretion pathway protein E